MTDRSPFTPEIAGPFPEPSPEGFPAAEIDWGRLMLAKASAQFANRDKGGAFSLEDFAKALGLPPIPGDARRTTPRKRR
jgi:hypothetical protein